MSQPGTGTPTSGSNEPEDPTAPFAPFDPAESLIMVPQAEWVALKRQVRECHRIATELESQLKPALARITSGNFSLSSLLFGGKGR